MRSLFRNSLAHKAGEVDPLLSMGQRAWDLAAYVWPSIVTFFLTGTGVSALGYFTQWAKEIGPLGIGLIALTSAITASVAVSDIQMSRARRRLLKIQTIETGKWLQQGDKINPLDREFHTKRVEISDVASPIHGCVVGKRFIDCEILGPRNVIFVSGTINNCQFINCDFVVVRTGAFIHNVTPFHETVCIGSVFYRCTVFVSTEMLKQLDFPVSAITLSGLKEFDDRPPPSPQETFSHADLANKPWLNPQRGFGGSGGPQP